MQRPNFYSGAGLDRADPLRHDEAWLRARLGDPATRFVAVWRSRNLVVPGDAPRPFWLGAEQVAAFLPQVGQQVFLGVAEERAYIALDLSHLEEPQRELALPASGEFHDLRAVGPLMARHEGSIMAYARGLMHWHRRHRFCGNCGHPTESRRGGHIRVCTEQSCGLQHFPRTDPAVIMLVHDGERCVLGRQKVWPPGMHSTLAGFVEPGESLEEAVAREVAEEVGLAVEVGRVRYHSSQPWPFPASIMLGFTAEVDPAPIRIYEEEIESARWFTRAELRESPEDETLRLPRRDSIARRLVEDWIAEG